MTEEHVAVRRQRLNSVFVRPNDHVRLSQPSDRRIYQLLGEPDRTLSERYQRGHETIHAQSIKELMGMIEWEEQQYFLNQKTSLIDGTVLTHLRRMVFFNTFSAV